MDKHKKIRLLIVGLLTVFMHASAYGAPQDENKITKLLVDSFVVTEFEAKNISVVEACKKLNVLFVKYQKDIGSDKLRVIQISLQKTPEMNKRKVFLHVKDISLKTIFQIICEQGQLAVILKKDKIELFFPIEE